MILTLTMNPAIDKTVKVEQLLVGGLNRLEDMNISAAGKGINVSKTIQTLGGSSIATGFLAGSNGDFIAEQLDQLKIEHNMILVEGNTRINLKIVDQQGNLTELNEIGPLIKDEEVKRLCDNILKLIHKNDILVLSGSIPRGVPKSIYATLIETAKQKGVYTILDADGELFQLGIKAKPNVIKPNKYELCLHFKKSEDIHEDEVIALGRTLIEDGIELVVISMGKDGAIFLQGKQVIKVKGLQVVANSSVGAGDAMVAALAYAKEEQLSFKDSVILAIATSAGAVTSEGTNPPSKEIVEELKQQVILEMK